MAMAAAKSAAGMVRLCMSLGGGGRPWSERRRPSSAMSGWSGKLESPRRRVASPRPLALAFSPRDLRRQRIEPRTPKPAEGIEPGVDRFEGACVHRVDASGALDTYGGEAVVSQHLEVLRDRRLGDAELCGD